ncbi:hypothetical protein L2E82_32499 [Cichorium intybus]|uniref:Uncharacterized protein n=1 Tax=Cichorium intybus TaxID=13427 RepID=A0ACB9BI41_CICIN|nr:hypothetical protein L2E82_32499 [Cichorium intybus]
MLLFLNFFSSQQTSKLYPAMMPFDLRQRHQLKILLDFPIECQSFGCLCYCFTTHRAVYEEWLFFMN